jgi:hypothetical protein
MEFAGMSEKSRIFCSESHNGPSVHLNPLAMISGNSPGEIILSIRGLFRSTDPCLINVVFSVPEDSVFLPEDFVLQEDIATALVRSNVRKEVLFMIYYFRIFCLFFCNLMN